MNLAIVVALGVAYGWFALRNYGYELDDALIYMRYVQNLIDGYGLVYNHGERFDGLTSPLFSYATIPIAFVTRNVYFATWFLSAASTYAAFCVFFMIFQKQLRSTIVPARSSAVLGLIFAVALPYFFSTYGMETGVFILFCALTLHSYLHRHWNRFLIFGTLLVLARPEGLSLIGACGLYHLVSTRSLPRVRLSTVSASILLVGCVAAANLYFFHTLWAETGAAKIWQGMSGYWGEHFIFWNVSYLVDLVFAKSATATTIMAVSALVGLLALGASELNLVVLIFLTIYASFYTVLNIPNYHWYYSAFFMFLPYYSAAGICYVVATLARGDGAMRARILGAAVLAVALYPICLFVPEDLTVRYPDSVPYALAGRWIAANTPADSSFAASEIGALGWYSQRRVVDILGLVNPGNARLIGERNFDGWVDSYKPDYLLTHDPLSNLEMGLYTFVQRFSVRQECGFAVPGYAFYKIEYAKGPSSFCDGKTTPSEVAVATPKRISGIDNGHVDSVTPIGNFVRVTGWATDGAGGPYGSLIVKDGAAVEYGMYVRYGRPDVAAAFSTPSYERTGYDLVLRFPTNAEARAWAAKPCVFTQRKDGPSALSLKDVDAETCGAHLPFASGFDP